MGMVRVSAYRAGWDDWLRYTLASNSSPVSPTKRASRPILHRWQATLALILPCFDRFLSFTRLSLGPERKVRIVANAGRISNGLVCEWLRLTLSLSKHEAA